MHNPGDCADIGTEASPERASEHGPKPAKRTYNEMNNESDKQDAVSQTTRSTANPPPDSLIDQAAAIKYWSNTPATLDGVLGGYPQVNRVDLQGSANFLAKLRRRSQEFPLEKGKLERVADCGAGIGRITKGFLSKVAQTVDIVEPVKTFSDKVKDEPCVGQIYNVGLERWFPKRSRPYNVIWNQWCVGQLNDAQFTTYLKHLPPVLSKGGWIVVKENVSNHHLGEDVFDETDNFVTRTDAKFRTLFNEAGLKIVSWEVQKGMPKGLYQVYTYALQPR